MSSRLPIPKDILELIGNEDKDPEIRKRLMRQRVLTQLVRARVAAGLKQRDVAEKLGRPPSVVSRFEHAGNDPTLSSVVAYADAVEGHLTFAPGRLQTIEELMDLNEKAGIQRNASEDADEVHMLSRRLLAALERTGSITSPLLVESVPAPVGIARYRPIGPAPQVVVAGSTLPSQFEGFDLDRMMREAMAEADPVPAGASLR